MSHLTEEQLIAYQMRETQDATAMTEHLEGCRECAAMSESIAETLRVFSAEAVPQVNLDHAWQRMRGSLPALTPARTSPARKRGWDRRLIWLATVAAAIVLIAAFVMRPHYAAAPGYANHRPGPLTVQPAGGMASHLDSAERLLTEVNHASGPMDEDLRSQAHSLELSNALYIQQAHASGDLAQAALLENLGRVLTTLDHEPVSPKEAEKDRQDSGLHLKFQMNTDGLLLDLRILQQNDQHASPHTGKDPQ